jgi:hypothetical protein
MTTAGIYSNVAQSAGLYATTSTTFTASTAFQLYAFYVSSVAPSTPTGGSWSFETNTGVAPSGWTLVPPSNPGTTVWASIAFVDSASTAALVWSTPGQMAYSQGSGIQGGTF